MTQAQAKARSRGREVALAMLYSYEQNRYADDGHLLADDAVDGADEAATSFAGAIFAGFCDKRVVVDAAIDKRLENWTIHRLAVPDRAILRLGAYELLFCDDTPPRVAINEAIELAKRYGSDAKTSRLVNGVLDRIARDHRPEGVRPRDTGAKGA